MPQPEQNIYQKITQSKLGDFLDNLDLTLDALSMLPIVGPGAAVLGTITGVPKGTLALYDGLTNGWDAQNVTDAMKLIPGGAIVGKLSKEGIRLAGKTTKYAKRAHPYIPDKYWRNYDAWLKPNSKKTPRLLYEPSGLQMIKSDKRYLPYFAPIYGADAINLGSDWYNIQNNNLNDTVKQIKKCGGKINFI